MLKAIFHSGKVSSAILCANYREVIQKFELLKSFATSEIAHLMKVGCSRNGTFEMFTTQMIMYLFCISLEIAFLPAVLPQCVVLSTLNVHTACS